ncbi:MAG: hypothetical protein H6713_01380 [Myxococcales bacterium]|nr:hypothetical protein [Myxococcales bacterium]
MRRRGARWIWALGLAASLWACADRGPVTLSPLDAGRRSERVAMGSVEAVLEQPRGGARARALAELALELGDEEAAADAAWQHLDHARAELALAQLDGAGVDEARRRLVEASAFAVALGDAARNGYLTLAGASYVARPQRHADAIERALRRVSAIDLESAEMRARCGTRSGALGARGCGRRWRWRRTTAARRQPLPREGA